MGGERRRVHRLTARSEGESLLDAAARAGLALPSDCGGTGVCGKCRVMLVQGAPSPHHPDEMRFLARDELAAGMRLACRCRVRDEVTVALPAVRNAMQIQEAGRTRDVALDPVITKAHVFVAPGTNESLYGRLVGTNDGVTDNPLAVARALGVLPPGLTAVSCQGRVLGLEAGDTRPFCFGVALDIGTTTLVAELVDLPTGRTVSTASMINPQFSLGADVLSRIAYAGRGGAHLETLASLLRDAVNELLTRLCAAAGADREHCYVVSVAGNTVMLHLFLGVAPGSLGRHPYRPVFLEALTCRAADLGLAAAPCAVVQLLPGLSGFVGADIVAGLLALDLLDARENALFVDMGTNGEIVLCHGGRIMATSTAAGPALEGMNISCGMKASPGAIDHVSLQGDGKPAWTTIAGAAPEGLCGSGLLDAVAALVAIGAILPSGRLTAPGNTAVSGRGEREGARCFHLVPPPAAGGKGVYLTQGDIRQVQLAKGAIAAGIALLLRQAHVGEDEIETVYVAGGFGFHVKHATLIALGMFPPLWRDRFVFAGNTSLAGARLAMLCRGIVERHRDRLREVTFYDLTACTDFDRVFARAMAFSAPSEV